jgi:hypothetical protein
LAVQTDFPWIGLAPAGSGGRPPTPIHLERPSEELSARGFLAEANRDFSCLWDGGRACITISGIGQVALDLAGGAAELAGPASTVALGQAALMGPALALLLAYRNRFVMHGSAIETASRAWLLLGDSGAGKSTIAAAHGQRDGSRRLADDQVALQLTAEGPVVPGPLPQPRLPHEFLRHPSLPVAGIFRLDPRGGAPRIVPIPAAEQALTLARHTVAIRLFPARLLRRHLAWSATIAEQDRIRSLSYAREPANLPEMLDLLIQP